MKLSLINKIKLGIIAALAVLALSLIFSQKASPDSPLFGLKRLQEKAFMKLKGSPIDRLNYMSTLLDYRLLELQAIINNKSFSYMWTTSLRYSTLVGQMTDLILTNNVGDKKDGIKKQFSEHKKVLNNLYVVYPKNTENIEYKYIEDDINYLKIYLEKLSNLNK